MGSRKEGNAEQKAKGLDGNDMLTPEGRKMNAAKRQLEKAQTAVDNQNKTKGRKSSKVAQTTAQNFLDNYNSLKDNKDKTRTQLSQLGRMNEQMGYNPTTGMGIMGSLNYNTIGAGADIANLMNNPLVKIAGMATNPAMFAGSMLGKNLYQNFTDEDKNTGFLNAASKTAQDVTPFDTSRLTDFLGNIFRQEEAEPDYVGSEVINTAPIEPVETGPLDGKTSSNTYQPIQGMVLDKILGFIEPVTDFYNQATTPLTDAQIDSNPLFNTDITPDNIDQYQNIESSPSLFEQGMFPRALETNDNINIPPGNNDGSNTPVFEDNPYFDPGVVEASLPFTGYGTINPGANYNQLYGFTAANGGRVPPMSGPMSNGIGTLYKQK